MKKLLTVLIVVFGICVASATFSQDLKVALEGNTAFAPGEFRSSGGNGFGPSIRLLVRVNPSLSLTAGAGFLLFSDTEPERLSINSGEPVSLKASVNAIPVLAGFRYYLTPAVVGLYMGAQAGLHRLNVDSEIPQVSGLNITTDDSRTAFSYGPTFGVEFGQLDFSASYLMIKDASFLGFHLGYAFLNF